MLKSRVNWPGNGLYDEIFKIFKERSKAFEIISSTISENLVCARVKPKAFNIFLCNILQILISQVNVPKGFQSWKLVHVYLVFTHQWWTKFSYRDFLPKSAFDAGDFNITIAPSLRYQKNVQTHVSHVIRNTILPVYVHSPRHATALKLNLDIVLPSWGGSECMFYALLPNFMWLGAEASIRELREGKKAGKLIYYSSRRHTANGEGLREQKHRKHLWNVLSRKKEMKRKSSPVYGKNVCVPHHVTSANVWHPQQNIEFTRKTLERKVFLPATLVTRCTFTKLIFFFGKLIFHWEITECKYVTWYTMLKVVPYAQRKEELKTKPAMTTMAQWRIQANTSFGGIRE